MFNGIPNNCRVIVADDNAKRWIITKFPQLTEIKTVGEI
jgi:hypothetical protein